MKKIKPVFIVFTLCATIISSCIGQASVWGTLGMVTFKTEYDAEFGIEIKKPNVSPVAMMMNGKTIEVEGYYIALTAKTAQSHFMLSKFTQNMCFFCGKAGPETAMQVFMKDARKVAYTDDKIKVKGILRISPKDANSLLYTLEDAIVIN